MSQEPISIKKIADKKIQLIGGISYLSIIVLGLFAEAYVRLALFIPNDASTTLKNLQSSEFIFRLSIVSDTMMIVFDIIIAWVIYILFKTTNKQLVLLTIWFRLIHAAVYAAVIVSLGLISLLINGEQYSNAIHNSSLILLLRDAHSFGYDLGLVFFGFHCVLFGYLICTSNIIPKVIGYMISAAGVVYLFGSFTRFLAPIYIDTISPIYAVALIAELSLAMWFLFTGFNKSND